MDRKAKSIMKPILLFITSPYSKKCFSKPQKELPLVAFLGQEKLLFFASGFPLLSGLVTLIEKTAMVIAMTNDNSNGNSNENKKIIKNL